MGDVDVRVGVVASGDPSGAQQVEQAIKDVGQTAQEVSQQTADAAQKSTEAAGSAAQKAVADAGAVADGAGDAIQKTKANVEELKKVVETPPPAGGLKDEVAGLGDALSGLSPEKAKGSIDGITQAIVGLTSGDTTKGLEGLARSLTGLATLIPMPGVAAALGGVVAAVVGAWKILSDGAGETARDVNEFGETIDVEMARLESWANSQFEFANLKSAIADVKSEFDSATKTTNTFRDAVLAAIDARYSGEATGLRQQAADARAGGDEAGAAALEEEAARRELISKIAQERVELEALQQQYKFQREKIAMAEESLTALIAKEKEVVEQFDRLKAASEKWAGNADAMFDGEARGRLIEKLEAEIAAREKLMGQVEFVNSQRHPLSRQLSDQDTLAGIGNVGKIKDQFSEVPSLRDLIENLKLVEKNAADYNAAVENQKTNYQDSRAAILEEGRALADLNAQRIRAAQDYATAIAGIDAGVVGEADRIAEGMTRLAERSAAAAEAAAQAGTGMVEAVETFGSELGGSTEAAAEEIGKGNEQIRSAVEGTGKEALAAGGEIKAGAEQFRQQLNDVLGTWRPAVEGLVSTGHQTLGMVSGLAAAQADLAQRLADTQRQLGLVQSQIRNME